jgi:hypothetical protein
VQGRIELEVVVVALHRVGDVVDLDLHLLGAQTALDGEVAERPLIGDIGGIDVLVVVVAVGARGIDDQAVRSGPRRAVVVVLVAGDLEIDARLQLGAAGHRLAVVELEIGPRLVDAHANGLVLVDPASSWSGTWRRAGSW